MSNKNIMNRIMRLENRLQESKDDEYKPWIIIEGRVNSHDDEESEETKEKIEQANAEGYQVLLVVLPNEPPENYYD